MVSLINFFVLLGLVSTTVSTYLPESTEGSLTSFQDLYLDEWNAVTQIDPQAAHHPASLFVFGASNLIQLIKNKVTDMRVLHFAEQSSNPLVHDLPSRFHVIYEIIQRTGSLYLGIAATVSYQVFGVEIEKIIYLNDLETVKQVLGTKLVEADFSTINSNLLSQIKSSDGFIRMQKNIPVFQEDLTGLKSFEAQQEQPTSLSQVPADSTLYPSKSLIKALNKSAGLLKDTKEIKVLHISVDNVNQLATGNLCNVEYLYQVNSPSESVIIHIKAHFAALPSESFVIHEVHLYNDLAVFLQKESLKLEDNFHEFYPDVFSKFMSNPERLQFLSSLSDLPSVQN